MSLSNSPEIVVSRLESQIDRSESRTASEISNLERRLESRIHNMEMRISRPDLDSTAKWLIVVYIVFILGLVLGGISSRRNSDDVQSPAHVQRSDAPTPQEPPLKDRSE